MRFFHYTPVAVLATLAVIIVIYCVVEPNPLWVVHEKNGHCWLEGAGDDEAIPCKDAK